MAEINVEYGLARDHIDDEGEEDDGTTSMRKILPTISDVRNGQDVELSGSSTTSGIDRKQNGPCYRATDCTTNDRYFQKPQEEIAVNRMMLENVYIGNQPKFFDPCEPAIG